MKVTIKHNGTTKEVEARLKPSLRLGDKVELVAKPFAKIMDRVLGTKLENCSGCQKRKERLNKL